MNSLRYATKLLRFDGFWC